MKINHHRYKIPLAISITLLALDGCGSGSTNSTNTSTMYSTFSCPGTNNVSFPGVSGIRELTESSTTVYVTGVYLQYGSAHAFLYRGALFGGGRCYPYSYPSSTGLTVTSTSLYGPDNGPNGTVVLTGSYTTLESGTLDQQGMLYQGAVDGSTTSGYITLNPAVLTVDQVINTLGHSTMGGIVVGNYDTNLVRGNAFIYDINHAQYYPLSRPGGVFSITAYGIWYNGGTSYTIAGGYSVAREGGEDIGYITDWDSVTHQVSHFTTLNYNNLPADQAGSHFEGITSDGALGYNLAANWQYLNGSGTTIPAFAHVLRNSDGSFASTAEWSAYAYYPGSTWTSANTVYQNHILGLYQMGTPTMDYGYIATFQGTR